MTKDRVSLKEWEKPSVVFAREALDKIQYFVNKCEVECSGFGTVIKQDNGNFLVKDIMLLPQRNGATSTDIEPEDMNRALFQLRDAEGDLNFWWHSHVNMGVFWSGIDESTIKQIGDQGWCLATVFNKRGEMRSALYVKEALSSSIRGGDDRSMFLDELDNEVQVLHDPLKQAAWDAEYKKNITDIKPKQSKFEGYTVHRDNSLADTRRWGDGFDFNESAIQARYGDFREEASRSSGGQFIDDGAPQSKFKFNRGPAVTGWLGEFEDELNNPPPGYTRHEFVTYLKKHKNVLLMDKLENPFEYLGYNIAKQGHLTWAKEEILMGTLMQYKEMKK